jgi:hypothetical protein
MRTDYYEKREERIERLRDRAAQRGRDATRLFEKAVKMASVIPFGQPILVGHHSEGRDRRYRAKIDGTFSKACEAYEEQQAVASRAAAAEDNDAISSDAPDAVPRMREKIADMEKRQTMMKAVNNALRKKDDAKLAALGMTPEQVARAKTPDCMGAIGFPDYKLKNNNANLRRCKMRLAHLERLAVRAETTPATEVAYTGGVTLTENAAENRLQVRFPGIPAEAVRTELKRAGFRWAPSVGAWQRQLTNGARWAAKQALAAAGIQTLTAGN